VTEGLRALNAERKKTASTDIRFAPQGAARFKRKAAASACPHAPTRCENMLDHSAPSLMRVNFFIPRCALPGPLRLGKMAWPKWKPVKQHRVAHWQLNSVGYERLPDPALSDRRGTPARDERGRGPCDWGTGFRSPSSLTSAPLGPPMSVRTHPGATTTNPAPSSDVGCVVAASTSIHLIAMRPRRGGGRRQKRELPRRGRRS
jgi:hypothetical protein